MMQKIVEIPMVQELVEEQEVPEVQAHSVA